MSKLTICTPLGFEARAVRRGLTQPAGAAGTPGAPEEAEVIRTGYGPRRSAAAAARLAARPPDQRAGALAVAGVGGALSADLSTGDIVVASEVRDAAGHVVACPSAPLLAGELRRAGLRVLVGPVVTVDKLVRHDHAALAAAGAIAVDLGPPDGRLSSSGPCPIRRSAAC
jgi:4-hydroxy-3-methylbut-2-enyl diphosphate reductase